MSARVPGPLCRIVEFTVAGALVYALLLVIGRVIFTPAVTSGTTYALSSTVSAGIDAFYLVYLGGFVRIRNLIR